MIVAMSETDAGRAIAISCGAILLVLLLFFLMHLATRPRSRRRGRRY